MRHPFVVRLARVAGIASSLLVLVLLVCHPGVAQTPQTGFTTATVTIPPTIEVMRWPSSMVELHQGPLDQDWSSSQLSFEIRSNTSWMISVHADSDSGVLQAFDQSTGEYADPPLVTTNPLRIEIPDESRSFTVSRNDEVLAQGAATGDLGKIIRFYLKFRPSFSDVPLKAGKTYRIQLIYTVGMGL